MTDGRPVHRLGPAMHLPKNHLATLHQLCTHVGHRFGYALHVMKLAVTAEMICPRLMGSRHEWPVVRLVVRRQPIQHLPGQTAKTPMVLKYRLPGMSLLLLQVGSKKQSLHD